MASTTQFASPVASQTRTSQLTTIRSQRHSSFSTTRASDAAFSAARRGIASSCKSRFEKVAADDISLTAQIDRTETIHAKYAARYQNDRRTLFAREG